MSNYLPDLKMEKVFDLLYSGWCSVRFKNSPARQEFMNKWHLSKGSLRVKRGAHNALDCGSNPHPCTK